VAEKEVIADAANSLDAFAKGVIDGWSGDQTFREAWGWNCPALTRHDLAKTIRSTAERIRQLSTGQVDNHLSVLLPDVPRRLQLLTNETLPYLYNGNCVNAYSAIKQTLDWINDELNFYLPPTVDWQDVESQKLMPRALLRRLRSIDAQLTNLEGKSVDLGSQVLLINDAHSAAESLPTDLKELQEARTNLQSALGELDAMGKAAEAAEKSITGILKTVEEHESQAAALVEKCGSAYSAATTKGLGEAFDTRARKLATSMWVWSAALIVSLSTGAWLAQDRISTIKDLLAGETANLSLIWINIVLSAFTVAAPVWFAWVSTKQIGQRFRLSEDYAFKASIAQAYEGYRREAISIDETLAQRLFSTALDRLDEAPLRLVETPTHGSPWHELANRTHNTVENVKSTVMRRKKTVPQQRTADEAVEA
jgi:hypothetical protein